MDVLASFNSLIRGKSEWAVNERALTFTARRDVLQDAALTIECGPHILHAALGLVGDSVFDYPGLDWSAKQDAMITCRLRPSLAVLARVADAGGIVSVHSAKSAFPLATFNAAEIPRNFVDRDHLALVRNKFGKNHWWTTAVFLLEDRLHVLGWAIPPKNGSRALPRVRIDDAPAEKVLPAPSPFSESTYWFLSGFEATGFYAIGKCNNPDGFSKIEVGFEDDRDAKVRRFPVRQFNTSFDRLALPVPPLANIHRVSGPGANQISYINGGKSDFERFRELIAEKTGRTSLNGLSVLDWGVGCGRLARYFIEESSDVTGADIDEANIAWCAENLRPGNYVTVPLMPPTPLESDKFDIIISSSVLSHLTEPVMHEWLKEMERVLKPGGCALLSFNGNGNSYLYGAVDPGAISTLEGYGFFDDWRSADLDGAVEGAESYYRFTLMSDDRAHEIFSAHFVLEDVVKGVTSGHQDIAVLRKR